MIRIVLPQFRTSARDIDKYIECWHCKGGISFSQVVPAICPKCKAKQPFAEHFLGVNKLIVEHAKKRYYKEGEISDATSYNFH
ncbi:hypothetical protein DRN34_03030 [Thermococci archaeon]|nr:MAG: hypothetical protein DRN34_03030 [Thermococci archaeon]